MMLEILQFVFQSFWHWAGTVILVGTIAAGIATAVAAVRGR